MGLRQLRETCEDPPTGCESQNGWKVVNATGQAIYVLCPIWENDALVDFRIRFVSDEAARQVQMPPESLVGGRINVLFPINVEAGHFAIYKRVYESGEPFARTLTVPEGHPGAGVYEQRVERIDGCVVAFLRDVTEWVRGREGERAAKDRLMAILSTVPDALVIADKHGTIREVNDAASRHFRVAPDGLIGRNIRVLMPREIAEQHDAIIERYLETGERNVIGKGRVVMAKRADGSLFPARLVVGESRDGDEPLFVGLIHDLTREMELERQLRSNERLEALGRLAGGIAHDFNNLLTVIQGQVELLGLKLHDRAQLEMVGELADAAERAALLTKQLLTVGQQDAAPVGVDELGRVVESSRAILREMLGGAARLVFDLAPSPLPVGLSRSRVEQLLSNLVTNARDAAPRTKVVVRTQLAEIDGESYAELRVSDDGCGMDCAAVGRAFDPFYTTKSVGKGTGLGLATVHAIVDQAQGRVTLESEVGVGTSVTILLPLLNARVHAASQQLPAVREAEGARVLLVEDDAAVRAATERLLEASGYEVFALADPRDALETLLQGRFDVVLTDVMMPHLSGRELAAEIAARMPDVPIVFMSGHTDDRVLRSGIVHNDVTFLQKPFSLAQLRNTLAQVFAS